MKFGNAAGDAVPFQSTPRPLVAPMPWHEHIWVWNARCSGLLFTQLRAVRWPRVRAASRRRGAMLRLVRRVLQHHVAATVYTQRGVEIDAPGHAQKGSSSPVSRSRRPAQACARNSIRQATCASQAPASQQSCGVTAARTGSSSDTMVAPTGWPSARLQVRAVH